MERVLAVLRWLLRAVWWLLCRLVLLACAALLALACVAFPWLRRMAWQTALMGVGLRAITQGGSVPRSQVGGQGGRGTPERPGSGNVPPAKLRPVSAQAVATSAEERQRYGVHALTGPGLLTEIVAAPGMGKTEARMGMLRAQFDGTDFCGLATTRGRKRHLILTEMGRPLTREYLRRWGFLVEPDGLADRVRLALWTPRGSPGAFIDVEYASRVFDPTAEGLTTDWPRVLHQLRRLAGRYDEITVDTLTEWMGSDANDHASEMLGLCGQLTRAGLGVTVLHHTPLSDPSRAKGGQGVVRATDALWALYGVGERGAKRSLKDPERYFLCTRLRRQEDAPDAPLRIALAAGDPHAGVLPRYRLVDAPAAGTGTAISPAPAPTQAPAPVLTDRQGAVLAALQRAPERTATTPQLAQAAGLTGDQAGETLAALVGKRLVVPAGTGAPNARGSKAPRRWKAAPGG